jgi:transposase-like protein
MVERKGKVVALAVTDTTAKTLVGNIHEFVLPASTVYTDELPSYNTVSKERRYQHKRIKHSANIYVMGDIHTNSVEGFWPLIKRGIGESIIRSVRSSYRATWMSTHSATAIGTIRSLCF